MCSKRHCELFFACQKEVPTGLNHRRFSQIDLEDQKLLATTRSPKMNQMAGSERKGDNGRHLIRGPYKTWVEYTNKQGDC